MSARDGIPREVVRRRYKSGISNFLNLYVPLADSWYVYDNSGATTEPVARRIRGGRIQLHEATVWHRIVASAR